MAVGNEGVQYHQLFQGVRFYLFGFNPNKKNQVRLKLLEGGGVEVSRCGPDCTHLIVDQIVYDDPVCVGARRDGKVVITSLWVDHSCQVGMLVDVTPIIYIPVRDLKGIPGAESFVICLTGYQRQDREDIMKMVELMGASFSKPLVATKITHLVCFKFEGEKYELAEKIGKIKLVNHIWLEDCLRAWKILPEADYNRSSYEMEIMEAEAKDSEEEIEQGTTEPRSCRKVQSPQNLRIERSPHQPSLVESDILRYNKCSNEGMILQGPGNCNDMPSVIKKNATSCSTAGLEGVQNRNPDLPNALDTNTSGSASCFPLNRNASTTTPEKLRNNLASTSKTAEKSPRSLSTNTYSRRSRTKGGLRVCSASAQRKSNPVSTLTGDKSTFNASDGFNLSFSIKEPNETSSAVVKTPARQHLEQNTTDELIDKREVGISGHNKTSQKKIMQVAALARSSHASGPPEIVSHLSASKATSCTEDQHSPSHEELIENYWNCSGLVSSNLSKEVGPNSNPKQGGKKMCKESHSEANTKSRPLDDETETPTDEANAFFASPHKHELGNMTSRKELSASGGAKNGDESICGKDFMTSDEENGNCDAVCSARVEVDETTKERTTAEIQHSVRKRALSTKEQVKKDAVYEDSQERMPKKIKNLEMPKKIKNDGQTEKKRKNSSTTSGRAKGHDQVIGGTEVVTKNKENSKCNTLSSAGDVLEKTSTESTTSEKMDKNRKRPLTKSMNHQSMKKAANNWETRENVSKILEKNEKIEHGEKISATMSGQSNVSAQEKSLSSLQVGKENSSVIFPDKGDEWHSGRENSKSKKKPSLTELKGKTSSNYGPELEEHATKEVKEIVWFLVSGHKFQRKEFQQVIKRLRGRVCRDTHNWSYQATHLILPDPIRRTEKFFGAAASGRWILKTDYLIASNEAGKLLEEHPYEWHKNSLTEDGSINLVAPRKWRLIRERTGHGAFYGMRIIVYGECIAPSLDTLKRAVKAGDGTILATCPPYTRFLESGVDFAIVSPGMPRVDMWIQEFLRHEIPCVLTDYLVEYVCKPGYSLDKHVQYGTHSWAEKSLKNLVSRMEEVVEE